MRGCEQGVEVILERGPFHREDTATGLLQYPTGSKADGKSRNGGATWKSNASVLGLLGLGGLSSETL